MQMEKKKEEKELVKAKQKAEDEKFERDLEGQRQKLDQQQHDELVKEGKRDLNFQPKAAKKVDTTQFMTSAELAQQAKEPKAPESTVAAAPAEAPLSGY